MPRFQEGRINTFKDKINIIVICSILFLIILLVPFITINYLSNQSLLQIRKIHHISRNGIPVEIGWKWSGREIKKQGFYLAEIIYRITLNATNEAQKRIMSENELEETEIYFKDKDGFNIASGVAKYQKVSEYEIISTGKVWVDKKLLSNIVDIRSTKY